MLGSGSRGNATYFEAEGVRILVDAGFSGKEVADRLQRIGVEVESLNALVLTHEHGDHSRGVGVLARRHGLPVYVTPATQKACGPIFTGRETVHPYTPGSPFEIGPFRVDPFSTVHDAADPVAVAITSTRCGSRVGIATDLGRPTAGIRHALQGCHFLILEANHDEGLLRAGPYPPAVQERIASSHGHLSNHAAARFLKELLHPELVGVLLAHLSPENNHPELALEVVRSALMEGGAGRKGGWSGWLGVASQEAPTELLDLPTLRSEGRGQGTRNQGQLSLL
jgi:phosphoribosyl 1,2-cyclic phosphodiesterase